MSRTPIYTLLPDPDKVYRISEETDTQGFFVGSVIAAGKVLTGDPVVIIWKILHQERIMEIKLIIQPGWMRRVSILIDEDTVFDEKMFQWRPLSVQSRGLDLTFRENMVFGFGGPLVDLRVGKKLWWRLEKPPRFLMTGAEYVPTQRKTVDTESGTATFKNTTRDDTTRTRIEGTDIQVTNEFVSSCGVNANLVRHRTSTTVRHHVSNAVATLTSHGTETTVTADNLTRGTTVALLVVHIIVMEIETGTSFMIRTDVAKVSDRPDDVHAVSVGDKRLAMTQVGVSILPSG